MLVRDGCQRDVTRRVSLNDNALVASNRTGQPGKWTVEYAIVTDDGHAVTASTNFQVSGSRDCNAPQANDEGQSAPPATNDGSATSGQDSAASGSSDGSSPWLILLGAAAGLIIAGAVTARLLMRRGGGAPAGRPGS